jgi:Fibronectin-attachment protein (FAP)
MTRTMNPRSARVLVFATALLTAPLLPAWSQAPVHPRPQPKKAPSKGEVVVKEDTPIDPNDPNQAPQTSDPNAAAAQAPAAPPMTSDPNAAAQPPATAPAAPDAAANPNAAKGLQPAQIGIAFAPPQGWQQGDPTKFTVPGSICCVWSPDNTSSIAAFVQNSGKPYNPRTLLEQSAEALHKSLNAEVKQKEVVTVGGMRAFSLVVSGPGTGAGIDGKGTVSTTQHWLAVPRDKDVVIFLMTTPDDKFAGNEAVFQTLLASLKVSGTQTPDQQAAK